MTFADLRLEVKSRLNGPGYRFLSDTRVNRFINQARQELDRAFLWPYRAKSVTGTAPLTIADLGEVEKVVNTSQSSMPLRKVDYQTLVETYGDLSTTGTPSYYYIAWPSGSPQVATYPTSSNTISVQYWKTTADLSADGDTPAAPSDFHSLIADMASVNALRANRLHKEADEYQQHVDRGMVRMLNALTPGIADGPDAYVGVTYASSDW